MAFLWRPAGEFARDFADGFVLLVSKRICILRLPEGHDCCEVCALLVAIGGNKAFELCSRRYLWEL